MRPPRPPAPARPRQRGIYRLALCGLALAACADGGGGGGTGGGGDAGAQDAAGSQAPDGASHITLQDAVRTTYDSSPADAAGSGPRVSGRVTCDRVPVALDLADGDARLDYSATLTAPVAGAVVALILDGPGLIALESTTDADGRYAFEGAGLPTEPVRVRVYAALDSPDYAVHDNTAGDAVYALESASVLAADAPFVDLHAGSGWAGNHYKPGQRAAAPFAILDTMRRLARRFEEVSTAPLLPLRVAWSPLNRADEGDNDDGDIGTTYWSDAQSTIFVLGDEDADTDEFDEHILTHEWGHYLMDRVSRDDSLGGSHPDGAVLDPRVAWSEGWSNALGAFLNAPGDGYGDTKGDEQRHGWAEDVEANLAECASDQGVFFECVVQSIAFDLLDPIAAPGSDHGDAVGFGWQAAVDLITGPLVTDTSSLITLTTVLATAKAAHPDQAAAIDALSKLHGVDPVVDELGSGQTTSDGGFGANLPLYHLVEVDGPGVVVKLKGHGSPSSRDNRAESNRLIAFRGTGQPVLVRTQADVDVDLFVFDAGHELASEEGSSGKETAEIDAKDGVLYVAAVQSWYDEPKTFPCQVTVSSTSGTQAAPAFSGDRRHAKPGPPVEIRFVEAATGPVALVSALRPLQHVTLETWRPGVRDSRTALYAGAVDPETPLTLPLPPAAAGARSAVSVRARSRVGVFTYTPETVRDAPADRPRPRPTVPDARFGAVALVPAAQR